MIVRSFGYYYGYFISMIACVRRWKLSIERSPKIIRMQADVQSFLCFFILLLNVQILLNYATTDAASHAIPIVPRQAANGVRSLPVKIFNSF